MIRRYFYIFSASLFILFTSTTGVKANFEDHRLEALARLTNSPPDGFNYQAVLRDSNNDPLANTAVTMRFTLSNTTDNVWIEEHTVTTNAFGLVTLVIGQGTMTGGTAGSFADIDWSVQISVQVEADSGDGFVDLGTSPLQSVPYAKYAGNGLTSAQATEITANTAKVGLTTTQADKLDAVDLDAEQNVQADWSVTDNTSDAFIQNQPLIPTDISDLTDAGGLLDGSTFDGSFNSLTDVPVNLDLDATDDFDGDFGSLANVPVNLDLGRF